MENAINEEVGQNFILLLKKVQGGGKGKLFVYYNIHKKVRGRGKI
jgi:hypothetical protein